MTIELTTVTRTSPLNAALKDGRVAPDGYRFRFEEVSPITKAFRIMCRELAYDVTEMAATTYLVAKDHGKPFTALPIFLTRGFHHRAVLSGELAAAVGDVRTPGLVPLLADADEAAAREARERGTWPVNHLVVVKDELLAAHRDLGRAVFDAFERAKDLYVRSGELEPLHARAAKLVGGDPLPYGLEPNRAVLEELVDFAVAQRILRRRPSLDELFAPV